MCQSHKKFEGGLTENEGSPVALRSLKELSWTLNQTGALQEHMDTEIKY